LTIEKKTFQTGGSLIQVKRNAQSSR